MAWFGALMPNVPITVINGEPNAAFVSQNVPTSVTAGQPFAVSVTMRNMGGTIWTAASSYRLGSQNPQGNLTWGTSRILLSASDSIAPGQQKTFSWTATAPTVPGTYNFQWRMLQESVAWFGDTTTNVVVTVTP